MTPALMPGTGDSELHLEGSGALADCLRPTSGDEAAGRSRCEVLGDQAGTFSSSLASSMARANPRALAIEVAADTVLAVPIIGATPISAPWASSSVRLVSAAARRFNKYEAGAAPVAANAARRTIMRSRLSRLARPTDAAVNLHDGAGWGGGGPADWLPGRQGTQGWPARGPKGAGQLFDIRPPGRRCVVVR